MFGFSHPTIAKLIQEMPGADKCRKYQPQTFVLAEDENDVDPKGFLSANISANSSSDSDK